MFTETIINGPLQLKHILKSLVHYPFIKWYSSQKNQNRAHNKTTLSFNYLPFNEGVGLTCAAQLLENTQLNIILNMYSVIHSLAGDNSKIVCFFTNSQSNRFAPQLQQQQIESK